MGIKNLFVTLGSIFGFKADAKAQELKYKHAADFANDTINKLNHELNVVIDNLATAHTNKDKTSDKLRVARIEYDTLEANAIKLADKNELELAEQTAIKAESVASLIVAYEDAVAALETNIADLKAARDTIRRNIDTAKIKKTEIETNLAITQTNDMISNMSPVNTKSIIAELNDLVEGTKTNRIKSKHKRDLYQEQSTLDQKTEAVLGTSTSALDRLKAKISK